MVDFIPQLWTLLILLVLFSPVMIFFQIITNYITIFFFPIFVDEISYFAWPNPLFLLAQSHGYFLSRGTGGGHVELGRRAQRWSSDFPTGTSTWAIYGNLIAGWWFWTWLLFSPIVGMMIQSDFHIFQRGWSHQPDRAYVFLEQIQV